MTQITSSGANWPQLVTRDDFCQGLAEMSIWVEKVSSKCQLGIFSWVFFRYSQAGFRRSRITAASWGRAQATEVATMGPVLSSTAFCHSSVFRSPTQIINALHRTDRTYETNSLALSEKSGKVGEGRARSLRVMTGSRRPLQQTLSPCI